MAARESSVTVTVRVRPFTQNESVRIVKQKNDGFFLGDGSLSFNNENQENQYSSSRFAPKGLRKIVDVVDDRMLIFDPPENKPLSNLSNNVIAGKRTPRFREHRFVFDKLFDEDASQEDVYYSTTRPLLDSVLDGFNATVFAYGATGCGKTHTISGTVDQPGIIFLTMKELFERIEELKDTKLIDISLSYLEIYNETIRDLMTPDNGGKLLALREDANKRITVSNLSSHKPTSVEDVMDMIIIGNRNRTSSPTEANATSSRSHAVLQINVTQRNRTTDIKEEHTFATLSIIDLAGSERAAATKNRGARLHEGANINRSLLALGNCINALCDVRRKHHVPYRDSKLTRLLKFSLGGNCKTMMIVCISPSSHHYDETLNTLKYADRAKQIKTTVMRNQHSLNRHVGSYLKMITEQKQEIEELRAREGKIARQAVDSYKLKNEKVSIGVLEFIDKLKLSLNSKKFEQLKLKKSLILAKRRILIRYQNELNTFMKLFQEIENRPEELNKVALVLTDLNKKIQIKIDELESLYNQETELDHVLANSAEAGINKLSELEAWDTFYKLILDTSLSLIRDSIEKTILQDSILAFDKVLNSDTFNCNFKFTSSNLFKIISQLLYLKESYEEATTSLKGEFQLILQEFYHDLEYSISDIINIDKKFEDFSTEFQYSINSDIQIPTSPIKKLFKSKASPFKPSLSISPRSLNKIITKVGKVPLTTTQNKKQIKKVRWSVPTKDYTDLGRGSEPEPEPEPDSDFSMEEISKVTDSLNNMNNKEDISIIDQSCISEDVSFSAPKKRKSLTSLQLKPLTRKSSNQADQKNSLDQVISSINMTPVQPTIGNGLGAPIRLGTEDIEMNE